MLKRMFFTKTMLAKTTKNYIKFVNSFLLLLQHNSCCNTQFVKDKKMSPAQETTIAIQSQIKLPKWLTASLFEDVLKKSVPTYKNIKNFRINAALSAGENYATQMLLIEVEVEVEANKTKIVSYMMKLPHDNVIFKQMLKMHNIFNIEAIMYAEVMPELEELYRAAGTDIKFCAEFYKLNTNENYILLEDLRMRGFKNANRLEGFDILHTCCVLKKMAQFHAATATRIATKGKYADVIMQGFHTEANRFVVDQMNDNLGLIFLKCITSYEGHALYKESMENLQPKLTDELYKIVKPDPLEFNVLNHGDCWANNIMFQYDAFGKIKETYFVDLQLPKYGTPAQDLYYMLLSSTHYDIKLKQFDYFIKYYHQQLVEHLEMLKYPNKIPSLLDIQMQLYKYSLWGIFTVFGVMGAVLLDPSENATAEKVFGDAEASNNIKQALYTNPRYRKHAEILLPWLYNRGALEC